MDSLLLGKLLLAMLCEEVILDVDELALLVHPLECVAAVAMFVDPSIRSAVVAKEHKTSMVTFRSARQEVKCGVVVQEEILGVPGLTSDHVGAFKGSVGILSCSESRRVPWIGSRQKKMGYIESAYSEA